MTCDGFSQPGPLRRPLPDCERRSSTSPEQRAEYPTRDALATVYESQLLELASVEPYTFAARARIDLHVFRFSFHQACSVARTRELLRRRAFFSLRVQLRPHLLDQIGVLAREILVFVSTRLLVYWHRFRCGICLKYSVARRSLNPSEMDTCQQFGRQVMT